MGLDIIELFLAVEDTFQIHIPDEEASEVRTVGDLHGLVAAKLQQNEEPKRCLTSAAFYRTRRGIVDGVGVERRGIRPATLLEVILPLRRRREKWRSIQAAMNLKLPGLQHPGWIQIGLLTAGVVLTVAPAIHYRSSVVSILLLFFLGLVAGGLLIKLTPALAVAFPNHDATVGELAKDVLVLNHGRLAEEMGGWNRSEIWTTLRRLIVKQTGVTQIKSRPKPVS
jgi:hypothetical protein